MPSKPDHDDPRTTTPDNAATAAQIRRDIDAGRARDKVDAEDPAAAPLGTDDEASGHPVTRRQAARAAEAEDRSRPPLQTRRRRGQGRVALVVLLALVALLLLAWWMGLGR